MFSAPSSAIASFTTKRGRHQQQVHDQGHLQAAWTTLATGSGPRAPSGIVNDIGNSFMTKGTFRQPRQHHQTSLHQRGHHSGRCIPSIFHFSIFIDVAS
ncbi:hypothetical protein Zmor_000985 [Zophobas morio]|uniref:Uncharacterized protein n=1 Tax=Zophobas morio TaxID=2755281 RepID=A0AA38IXM3_9CUCU|nr:hypothetical protein Zmor_000985 [Zophobas morio]